MTLNEDQRYTLINALYVARARYEDNAKALRLNHTNQESLARQFDRQAEDATLWAERIEAAMSVIIA